MKVLRAGVIYTLGNIAAALVPFALLPILTRVLSPAEYGVVVIFSLMVLICTPFAGLSVSGAVGVAWFKRSKVDCARFMGGAFSIIVATTIITASVAFVGLTVMPTFNAVIRPDWIAMAALTAGMVCLLQCRLGLWQSQQRPYSYVLLQVSSSICNVGLSLLLVIYFGRGADGRNAGIVFASVLVGVVSFFLLVVSSEIRWDVRAKDIKMLLGYGASLIPHVVSGGLIGTADRWMVAGQLGDESLGIYSAGAQLGMVMGVIADACAKAYAPWLYARLAAEGHADKRAAVGAIYLAVPFFLLMAFGVGTGLYFIGGVLLGAKYQAGLAVLPWFVLGGAFTGVYLFTTNLFFFSGRTALLSLSTTSSAATGMGVTWLSISHYGVKGAAIGYATTQAILAFTILIVAIRTFDLPWRKPQSLLLGFFAGKT